MATLGASLALTGPETVYANQLRHALELALEDAGTPSVSLYIEDDASEKEEARAAAERLAADPAVFAVVGPMNSWTAEVQAPIFARAGLAQLTPSASKPELSQRRWASFFRMCANDLEQGKVLARLAADVLHSRSVGTIHDGTSFGEPLANVFAQESERLGMDVSCRLGLRFGEESSFVSAARAVARHQPDAVLVVGLEDPCRDVARAMREEGVKSVFLGTDAIKPTQVLVTPGFEGPYLTNAGTHAADQIPEFHRRFESRFGTHHSIYTVEAYDAARLLVEVMNDVGRERARVVEALRSLHFEGMSGSIRFDDNGERRNPVIGFYRYDDGLHYLGTAHQVLSRGAEAS